MNYHEPKPITPVAFERVLERDLPEELCNALVDATHSITDRGSVTKVCLRLLAHSNEDVKGAAVTCLGHIARLDRRIDIELVGEGLRCLYKKEKPLQGRIRDAVDDIRTFTGEDIVLTGG